MRYVYIGLGILSAAAIVTFKLQNLQTVTVSFLSVQVTMPLSLLVIVVYILGMVTGGFVSAFVKAVLKRSRRTSQHAPTDRGGATP